MTPALALAALFALAGGADAPGAAQERGRQLYQNGRSASGQTVTALLGSTPIDASLTPCAACHGDDGRGRAEGGVRPADISPRTLARPLDEPPRSRPAYTPAHLKRAITMGLDAAAHPLDRAMPRFQLTQGDVGDLVAYLAVLGDVVPGVSEDRIVVNLVGSRKEPTAGAPIYGRRVVVQHDRRDGALLTVDVSDDGRASVLAAQADSMPTLVIRASVAPGTTAFLLSADADARSTQLAKIGDQLTEHALLVATTAMSRTGHTLTRESLLQALRQMRADELIE